MVHFDQFVAAYRAQSLLLHVPKPHLAIASQAERARYCDTASNAKKPMATNGGSGDIGEGL